MGSSKFLIFDHFLPELCDKHCTLLIYLLGILYYWSVKHFWLLNDELMIPINHEILKFLLMSNISGWLNLFVHHIYFKGCNRDQIFRCVFRWVDQPRFDPWTKGFKCWKMHFGSSWIWGLFNSHSWLYCFTPSYGIDVVCVYIRSGLPLYSAWFPAVKDSAFSSGPGCIYIWS